VKPGIGVSVKEDGILPDKFNLFPNYPNPFNPSTTIRYDVPASVHVEIKIFNQLGHEVRTLVNQSQNRGSYSVNWDGRDVRGNKVSSGMYFYQIKAGDFIQTNKMLLIL